MHAAGEAGGARDGSDQLCELSHFASPMKANDRQVLGSMLADSMPGSPYVAEFAHRTLTNRRCL